MPNGSSGRVHTAYRAAYRACLYRLAFELAPLISLPNSLAPSSPPALVGTGRESVAEDRADPLLRSITTVSLFPEMTRTKL